MMNALAWSLTSAVILIVIPNYVTYATINLTVKNVRQLYPPLQLILRHQTTRYYISNKSMIPQTRLAMQIQMMNFHYQVKTVH